MKVLLAALFGSLVMFVWGAVSHLATPLGEMGVSELPGDETLNSSLERNLTEDGFYFFPGGAHAAEDAGEEAMEAWAERYELGPAGIVVVRNHPGPPMGAKQLGSEYVSNLVAALLAALVMSGMRGGLVARWLAAILIGLAGVASITASYGIWYGFPQDRVVGELLDQGIGWAISGLVMAWILRPGPKK